LLGCPTDFEDNERASVQRSAENARVDVPHSNGVGT
jgi:hypothetical protein